MYVKNYKIWTVCTYCIWSLYSLFQGVRWCVKPRSLKDLWWVRFNDKIHASLYIAMCIKSIQKTGIRLIATVILAFRMGFAAFYQPGLSKRRAHVGQQVRQKDPVLCWELSLNCHNPTFKVIWNEEKYCGWSHRQQRQFRLVVDIGYMFISRSVQAAHHPFDKTDHHVRKL